MLLLIGSSRGRAHTTSHCLTYTEGVIKSGAERDSTHRKQQLRQGSHVARMGFGRKKGLIS